MAADPLLIDAHDWTPRIFGHNEAEAMFESVYSALPDRPSKTFVVELQAERELLLRHRDALSVLLRAVGTENFNRTGLVSTVSTNLRAAIRQAEEVLS